MTMPSRGYEPPEPEVADALAPISIEVRPDVDADCWVVSVVGEIDVATSPHLRAAIARVVDQARRVSVDLSGTTFIDSSGLGVLVGALKRAREGGHQDLELRGLQEPVRRVFEITGLTELFPVNR
jgi:anti-sigma B factor antagonist